MLARQLDAEVDVVNNVPFNQDPRAAVHVDAIRGLVIAVGRIASGSYAVHQIFAHHSIASLIDGGIGSGALGANDVDADVVVIVHDVVRDPKVGHVSVHDQRFAGASLQVMNLIAVDDEIGDGLLCIGAVDRNAERVGASSGSVPARES